MTARVSSFDDADQIGVALTAVRGRAEKVLEELRELRRELVIHGEDEAEGEVASAVRQIAWAVDGVASAVKVIERDR